MSTRELSSILPISQRDFQIEVDNITKILEIKSKELVHEFAASLTQIQKEIQDKIQAELHITTEIKEKLDHITGSITGDFLQKLPIDARFERQYYKDFYDYITSEKASFRESFLQLVSGLDEKSIQTVVLSIQRLKLVMQNNDALIALYTAEEFSVMKQRMDFFYSSFLELSERCFYWNGYMLPVNHFEACVFADRLMVSELDYQERLVGKDIIDAGAFIGDSALILSRLTTGRIHAFEPSPENYSLAKETIEMNSLNNVTLSSMALGIRQDTTSLSLSGSASSQFENPALHYDRMISVSTISVDEYVNENKLRIGLIKADIEGAESLMLQGAVETIKTQKPALIISIYHNARDYFGIKPWLESLNLGYRFKIRHSICGSIMTDTMLIAEVP